MLFMGIVVDDFTQLLQILRQCSRTWETGPPVPVSCYSHVTVRVLAHLSLNFLSVKWEKGYFYFLGFCVEWSDLCENAIETSGCYVKTRGFRKCLLSVPGVVLRSWSLEGALGFRGERSQWCLSLKA